MTRSDLTFGVKTQRQCAIGEQINVVGREIANAFDASFEWHFSSYLGGNYLRSTEFECEVRITANQDDDELAEPEYPDAVVLILVDGTRRGMEWKRWATMTGAMLIRELEY